MGALVRFLACILHAREATIAMKAIASLLPSYIVAKRKALPLGKKSPSFATTTADGNGWG